MFALEPFAEGAAGEDGRGETGRREVAGAIADVDDEIAEVAESAGVGQLEAGLEFDTAGAVVADAPAVGKPGAAAVADESVEPVGVEDRVDIEVETVADNDGEPVVPVGPVEEFEEPGAEAGRFEGEGAERGGIGLDEVEGGGVVLLDGEVAGAQPGFKVAPAGGGEALEELAGGIVEDDSVVEVEADDVCHGTSFARTASRRRGMRPERARWLASRAGREALEGLGAGLEGLDPAGLAGRLRRTFPAEVAAALGEQLALRQRARERFGELPVMLYTAEGLEMMTHPLVARRRAARVAGLGLAAADLTCGLGGDLAALAGAGVEVLGVEREEATAVLAGANVRGRVARGDAARPPCDLQRLAVLVDPGRRRDGRRTFDPAAFSPPWGRCLELLRSARSGSLKGPPGLERGAVPGWCELEAVQVGRDLRELTLWAGEGAEPGLRRAVLLPGGYELDSRAPASGRVEPRLGRYLFDPESCVTRAGLVEQLAAALGAWRLDGQVAYLSSDTAARHPLSAAFEVLETVPFGVKRLRALLRARGWRPAEIRKRAFPVEPEALRRELGRLDGTPVTLVCTTVGGRRVAAICRAAREGRPEGSEGR